MIAAIIIIIIIIITVIVIIIITITIVFVIIIIIVIIKIVLQVVGLACVKVGHPCRANNSHGPERHVRASCPPPLSPRAIVGALGFGKSSTLPATNGTVMVERQHKSETRSLNIYGAPLSANNRVFMASNPSDFLIFIVKILCRHIPLTTPSRVCVSNT